MLRKPNHVSPPAGRVTRGSLTWCLGAIRAPHHHEEQGSTVSLSAHWSASPVSGFHSKPWFQHSSSMRSMWPSESYLTSDIPGEPGLEYGQTSGPRGTEWGDSLRTPHYFPTRVSFLPFLCGWAYPGLSGPCGGSVVPQPSMFTMPITRETIWISSQLHMSWER